MVKIGLSTIEALCIGLRCTPAELFKITPPVISKPGIPDKPAVKAAARPAKKMQAKPKPKASQVGSVAGLKFGQGKGGKKTAKKSK